MCERQFGHENSQSSRARALKFLFHSARDYLPISACITTALTSLAWFARNEFNRAQPATGFPCVDSGEHSDCFQPRRERNRSQRAAEPTCRCSTPLAMAAPLDLRTEIAARH